MKDITVTEWRALVPQLAAAVDADVAAHDEDGFRICGPKGIGDGITYLHPPPAPSVSVELRTADAHMVVRVSLGQSSTSPADLVSARALCNATDDVLRRAEMIAGMTACLRVWLDGTCPCGSCGGRGEDGGLPCKRCGGEGVR